MKRLLCVVSAMNAGGAETFLMKIYRALDQTKYQMDFCINIEGECFYTKEIERLGGKIYHIPSKSESVCEFKKKLTAIIKENHYEYVLRITSNAAGFMDLKIAKKAGAKVCSARSSNSSDGVGWKVKLAHRFGRLLYGRYVDVKFAPSDLAAAYTFGEKAYQNGEVTILHNGVDLDVFRYDEAGRAKVRSEFGISAETKIIGHVGRFMTQKNHAFLINVFSEIHKKYSETKLLLVGGGELEPQIRTQINQMGLEDAVTLTGVRSDIPQLLSAMDVFVFPSLYEGMPNTVIEAQATGLPCVIADTITKEADITGLVKYLPLSGSTDVWAETALYMIQDKRKDTRNDFVAHHYDIDSVVMGFVKLVFQE